MQVQIVSSHGLLAILEVLESRPSRDVTMNLLKLVNIVSGKILTANVTSHFGLQLVVADLAVLESFCLIG